MLSETYKSGLLSLKIDEIRKKLAAAVRSFEEDGDIYLLQEDLNERTISHRFAIHLQRAFEPFHVDCEYNRAHGYPKRLRIPNGPVSWEDTEAKTVFPDIIVHERGEGQNILVVEMKKIGRDVSFDKKKLRAYCFDHAYQEAALLVVRTRTENPGFEAPCYYNKNEV